MSNILSPGPLKALSAGHLAICVTFQVRVLHRQYRVTGLPTVVPSPFHQETQYRLPSHHGHIPPMPQTIRIQEIVITSRITYRHLESHMDGRK